MDERALPTLRWVRAGVLGVVVLAVGAVAHAASGGLLPGLGGLTVLLALCVAGGAAFLGRASTTLRLVMLVIGGQAFVHTALAGMAGHRGDPVAAAAVGQWAAVDVPAWNPRSGVPYEQWAQQLTGGQELAPAVPAWLLHAVAEIGTNPTMALLHVVAAGVVGAWLAVGERSLFALLALASNRVLELARRWVAALNGQAAVLCAQGHTAVPVGTSDLVPRRGVWSRGAVRRGPPVLELAR